MKKNILFIFLIVTFSQIGMAQWVSQTSGAASNLMDVSFPSIDTGYLAQDNGIIFKTVNGGSVWNMISSTPSNVGYNVIFTTNTTGYSPIDYNIYKTTNGGTNWSNLQFYTDVNIQKINFLDLNNGFAIGCNLSTMDTVITLKTTNAGNTWSIVSKTYNSDGFMITGFDFFNSSIGYYSTPFGDIFKTINGGLTWFNVFSSGSTFGVNAIQFLDINNGYCAGDFGIVLKTINGGSSWTQFTSPTSLLLNDVFFIDVNNGYVCGGDGASAGIILKTTNGGTSWTTSLSSSKTYVSFSFPSSTVGYACGNNGEIRKISLATAIENSETRNNLSIYPNPSNGKFTISASVFSNTKKTTISIFDVLGNLVLSTEMKDESIQIDISEQAKGIYFLRIENEDGVKTEKLIYQ